MRHLLRIRGPACGLSGSTKRHSTSVSYYALPACVLKRDLSEGPRRNQIRSEHRTSSSSSCQPTLRIQRRQISSSEPRSEETRVQGGDSAAQASELSPSDFEAVQFKPPPPLHIKTDLKYPRKYRATARPGDVTDPTYTPAEKGEGLEEVGGLEGWWEQPGHWGESSKYKGFGPETQATESHVLTAVTRRALIEALALRQTGDSNKLTTKWSLGMRKSMVQTLELPLDVAEDGSAQVGNEAGIKNLKADLFNHKGSLDKVEFTEDLVPELRNLVVSWGENWKRISLEDPKLKFAVTKRVQQLTGQVIPDSKLGGIHTVGGLLRHLMAPPKPKKLAEELERNTTLQALPNVAVHSRRVTPIDKEKMVGRWKVIVKELETRGLPVIGTGGYDKSPELKWAEGKP